MMQVPRFRITVPFGAGYYGRVPLRDLQPDGNWIEVAKFSRSGTVLDEKAATECFLKSIHGRQFVEHYNAAPFEERTMMDAVPVVGSYCGIDFKMLKRDAALLYIEAYKSQLERCKLIVFKNSGDKLIMRVYFLIGMNGAMPYRIQ